VFITSPDLELYNLGNRKKINNESFSSRNFRPGISIMKNDEIDLGDKRS